MTDGNELTVVPDVVFELEGLEVLSVARNALPALPAGLPCLPRLRTLCVARNRLAAFPRVLRGCALARLDATGNAGFCRGLELDAGDALAQTREDAVLDACAPDGGVLPPALACLARLRVLSVRANGLVALDGALLARLAGTLARLDVADNALAGALPDAVAQLTRLEVLDVSYNRLTALPAALASLPALRVLRAAANALTALPRELGDAPALQTLDVSRNCLAQLPHELCALEGTLRELQLYGNPLDPALADTAARKSVQGVLAYLRRVEEECYLAGSDIAAGGAGPGGSGGSAGGGPMQSPRSCDGAPVSAVAAALGGGAGALHRSVSVSLLRGKRSAAPRHLGVMGLFGEGPAGTDDAQTQAATAASAASVATTPSSLSTSPRKQQAGGAQVPTLREVLADPLGYQSFREFLCEECSEENLTFWSDVEQYRHLGGDDALREARRLYDRYLGVSTAKYEINVPGPVKSRLKRLIVDSHDATPTVFDAAQKNVFELMATDSFPRFLKSSYFEIYDGIRTHTK